MTDRTYPAVIVQLSDEDGGGFAAYAPDLYGCMGDGETQEAALLDLQSAILEWIDETVRLGRPVPEPGSCLKAQEADQKHLLDVIQKQDRLLEAQDELIAGLDAAVAGVQSELDEIKSDVKATLDRLCIVEAQPFRGWRISRALHFPVVDLVDLHAEEDSTFLPLAVAASRTTTVKGPH
mgnify:CR=1 FL=1